MKKLHNKFFNFHFSFFTSESGQMLVELLLAIGISSIFLPALITGLVASREGKVQQGQRMQAVALLKETEIAVKGVRNNGWTNFAVNGTYHPIISGTTWALASGAETVNGFARQVVISDIYRDSSGAIVSSGGTLDPSTKQAVISVGWEEPYSSAITSTIYLSRTGNMTYTETTAAQFNAGTKVDVQVPTPGDVRLANNNKAKWCSPAFASTTIDLPDGPPVAVAATASAVMVSIPNDVYVATSPSSTSATKMVYVTVPANVATPSATLRGKFTIDASQFSVGHSPQTGTGLDNNFKTNDIKYYTSSAGKRYALLATDLADKEIVVVQVNDNDSSNDETTSGEFQDPTNNIYKYWTFFSTRRYDGVATNDQAPFGYGATTLTVYGDRGYVASGGYLYVFNLSNIDSKSTSSGLDMVGCRIQLDGYDCRPGSPGSNAKYSSGQSGTSWGDTATPAHNDCSDGGNIELYATNDIYPVQVGTSTYIYTAVGAGTNPEFNIANVSSVPTSGSSPSISNNSCGRISGGNSSWRRVGSYDFNTDSGTEEAANSVFAKSDGTRAYISSNGGIDGNDDNDPDSEQFYILNTTSKTSPTFLSGSPSSGPSSGYYTGSGSNGEMYPRRSLTVLNGERVVLVGKDSVANGNDAEEYQVLDNTAEASPAYCSGLNFDQGFNDLTSVSELDADNFVYMVANTTANELKIIEGGPDSAIYVPSGTFESQTFDASYAAAFNRFSATVNQPGNTSLQMQVAAAPSVSGSCSGATFNFVGPNGDPNQYFTPVGASISATIPFGNYLSNAYQNPARCFRYKAWFSNSDQTQTPRIDDIILNYSP